MAILVNAIIKVLKISKQNLPWHPVSPVSKLVGIDGGIVSLFLPTVGLYRLT